MLEAERTDRQAAGELDEEEENTQNAESLPVARLDGDQIDEASAPLDPDLERALARAAELDREQNPATLERIFTLLIKGVFVSRELSVEE